YLKDVNARTKKPKVVPISASKPKRKANKSVATPHKKTVASDTTIQKSKSYYKELYENTNQEWKWWIAKRCPSGYKWTQKPLRTKKIWMPKIRKEDVSTSISPTIDIVSRITNIVQLILFIVDSGCTKHMTGNLKLLCNFVEKFLGTVRFGNDQFAPILGYGDLNQGNVTIKRVYYVEGLNHNLFSVGQFCDADLEVAFRKSTCFVRDLQGNDLLTGNRGSDLYTISLQETTSSTPICFMAKASPTQAWLWHRRLSHLNFDYITLLSKKDIVTGLPKLKYVKDQLCSSCEMSKAKRSSFKSKVVPSSKGRLNLLHMDLCGPMRVASINGKKYILVIVDDYSRYTWTLFLRSMDETPEVLKDFLTMIQRNLQAQVITVRTDRGTEFLNKMLHAYFKEEGIEHQTSTPRTPEQNSVVERWNRTLVEAAQTMLSASKLHYHFGLKQLQPHAILRTDQSSYRLMEKRHGENLDKMKEKGDPCVMVGYSTQSKGYRVYNKRTRLIVESIHIKFDEIKEMMSDHNSSDLAPQRQEMSVENVSSGLVPQGQKASDYDNSDPVPPRQNVVPTAEKTDSSQQGLEFLFSPLLEEYYNPAHGHDLLQFLGNDLLTGNRGSDLYTISLQETTSSTPICFMAKASPTQAWLWHRRLSHLNFDYITLLSKKDIVTGLPKLKYVKDQLCSSCEMSKAKRSSFKSKAVPSSKGRLNLLHMDLCGPMRVASINGKKYILVIVDDYSRYTWTLFLRSKDETPEVLKDFLTMIQRNLQAQVISVRTDRGTKQNRTLVKAARTMLSASKLPLSFWAEAVAIACYTHNRSIIISAHGKMMYHIINDRKPLIKHLHIFGCICYITRDGEILDKMKEKGDPCVMVGYSTQSKGYRVYNKRTRLIVEYIHIKFDEIKQMMSDHNSSDLALQRQEMSVENVTSGLVPQGQKASDYDNSDPVPPR
ncbi:retrovirus-related pol polyprotein from transposon TNT 1-94, partial [Tanacetum coccineum]